MHILIIANNIVGDTDGIGKHARMELEELSKREGISGEIISGTTTGFSIAKRIVSDEMHRAFAKAIKYVSENKPDAVIVEYPFNEYNPIVVGDYIKLHRSCIRNSSLLALSMHEYDRVRLLRKKVIEVFIKNSDAVFVSEPHYIEKLSRMNPNIYLRTIPNHIVLETEETHIDRKRFAYFGMINKAKAFDELIEAWKIFNQSKEYALDVITISEIQIDNVEAYNIKIHIGEKDKEVAKLLGKAAYAVLPIKPSISYNNSSFVACAQCGCVVIGKPAKQLKTENIVLETSDYSVDSLQKALNEAISLSDEELETRVRKTRRFGSQFSIESTVSQVLKGLENAGR